MTAHRSFTSDERSIGTGAPRQEPAPWGPARVCEAPQPDGRACGAPGLIRDPTRARYVCARHMTADALFQHVQRAAEQRPDRYVGASLVEFPAAPLAAGLQCSVGALWHLRTAPWPRATAWEADVEALADRMGCPPHRLARLLHHLQRPAPAQQAS